MSDFCVLRDVLQRSVGTQRFLASGFMINDGLRIVVSLANAGVCQYVFGRFPRLV